MTSSLIAAALWASLVGASERPSWGFRVEPTPRGVILWFEIYVPERAMPECLAEPETCG